MELLKPALAFLFVTPVFASVTDSLSPAEKSPTLTTLDGKTYKVCQSSKEFKGAFKFLREEKDLSLRDEQVLKFAVEIAKGCDGAAARFGKVFLLLKKSGVDQIHALQTALSFASMTDAQADGFCAIFQKVFLENYLNMDFANAFKLSLTLSRDYSGDVSRLKSDFVEMVKYCLDEKGLALDYTHCTEVTVGLTKYSELFPKGVFTDFKKLYEYLRFNKRTGLNVKDSLAIILKVMARGPAAPQNFIETLKYALEKNAFEITQDQALKLALQIADFSMSETTR
ncbi:MAG: hypothetical protein AB7N80_16020 [Bdellovibrionales bacterium]